MDRPPAPNYTNAFLVSFGGVLFIALFAIWVIWGLLAALVSGWVADKVISRRIPQSD